MEYICMKCGYKFTRIQLVDGHQECPECHSDFIISGDGKAKMTMKL